MTDAENPQLQKLIKQKAQIEERIKDAKSRQRNKQRKQDTRRKIIIGAIAESHMELYPNEAFTQELKRLLNTHVTKPKDRELIGLPPLSATEEFSNAG